MTTREYFLVSQMAKISMEMLKTTDSANYQLIKLPQIPGTKDKESIMFESMSVDEILHIFEKLERHVKAMQELEDLHKQLKDDITYFDNRLASGE